MNRATTLATLAGLALTTTTLAQPGVSAVSDPTKQPTPATKPASPAAAKPKTPVKPAIVDLQEAAKQPRKRAPRTPSATVPPAAPTATAAPAPTPAPSTVPEPVLVQPPTPIVAAPIAASQEKTAPAAEAQPTAAAPNVSIISSTPSSAEPAAPIAAAPAAASVAGPAVDIESVATKPAKGELRRPPVDIGPQENERRARQTTSLIPAETPANTEPAPVAATTQPAPSSSLNDQRIPNPTASLLPAAQTQSAISASFVNSLTNNTPSTPTSAPTEPEPASLAKPIASVEVTVPTAPAAPTPPAVTERVAKPSAHVENKPIETKPTPQSVKQVEPAVETPKPLDVRPAPEPLPPLPPVAPAPTAPSAPETPEAAKPVEPTAPTPAAPLPSMPVEVKPVELGSNAIKPVEIKGPEVHALDTSKIKLNPPPAPSSTSMSSPALVTPPEPIAAPAVPAAQPSPAAADVKAPTAPTAPVNSAPTAPIPTPTAAQSAVASEPEPVAVKVISLTGTPGMVQWQIDGGTQWLIPETDEAAKARFVVRTGPDAGMEMLVDESTRVRLGRFSRAEVCTLETADDAGTGKRVNIQLMRGVVYVTPGKGKVITVQTPARAVMVKEPTQVTHDNSGTRSVSFTEQPNSGASATAPSANP